MGARSLSQNNGREPLTRDGHETNNEIHSFLPAGSIMQQIRQILFVPPAPIVWAEHLDLFRSNGIDLQTTLTVSSDQIGQGLADGTWDIGVGVVDNIIAWNQERRAGLQILAQLEHTQVMAFCARAGCTSLADAARGLIGVDATSNGFVLALYRALAREGIDRAHCRFEAVGGVRHRFEALLAGRIDATILVPPFIDKAIAAGCTRLWAGEDVVPAYPGVVAAARAEWLRANETAAASYLEALLAANAWAMAPENADAAAAALVAKGYAEPAAARLVRNPVPDLEVSLAGWDETVALRQECGCCLIPNRTRQQ
jgi:ABC-type nitrate/sulfonate/bicarbonate transport system substrate-binding protein